MLVTKRLTRPVHHVSKELFKRRLNKPEKDLTTLPKVFFYDNENFTVQVGCLQIIHYYGIDFERVLN